jgi:hypothetical protein
MSSASKHPEAVVAHRSDRPDVAAPPSSVLALWINQETNGFLLTVSPDLMKLVPTRWLYPTILKTWQLILQYIHYWKASVCCVVRGLPSAFFHALHNTKTLLSVIKKMLDKQKTLRKIGICCVCVFFVDGRILFCVLV